MNFVKFNFVNKIFLFFFLLWTAKTAFAQPADFNFNRLAAHSNLSSNYVNKMVQDSIGYIWIATSDGVNRYDGNNIVVYKGYNSEDKTGLFSSLIKEIFIDSKERLWVGTAVGISIYDNEYDEFRILASGIDRNGLSTLGVHKILEDKLGRILVITSSYIYLYDEIKCRFELLFDAKGKGISSLLFDENNGFWIGYFAGGGIEYFSSFDSFEPDFHLEPPSHEATMFDMVFFEEDIWIAAGDDGILVVDLSLKKIKKRFFHDLNKVHVKTITLDRSGNLWSIDFKGLKLYNPTQDNFTSYTHCPKEPNSLQPNLQDIFEDHQGNFYTMHDGNGVYVNYIQAGFQTLAVYKKDFLQVNRRHVSAINEDGENNLWLGSFNGGIEVFKWKEGQREHYYGEEIGLGLRSIMFLYRDSQNRMWTSSFMDGLKRFDSQNNKFQTWRHSNSENSLCNDNVRAIVEDSIGNFWIATHGGGLDYYDVKVDSFVNFNMFSHELYTDWVNDILVDNKNRLWVATSYGISMKEPQDSDFGRLTEKGGLKTVDVICLLQSSDGTIWAGTRQGLYFFVEPEQEFKLYEQFPENFIASIEEDQNSELWIGTHAGLWKLNPETGRVNHFDEYDGLRGTNFNLKASYFDKKSTLYFGGPEGLNLFNPNELKFNTTPPPLRFSKFLLFNIPIEDYSENGILKKDLNFVDEVVLQYDQNFFTIEFTAFNFINSSKNKYSCKLEGFDENWVDRGNERNISYTNLFPGKYTFKVKASNNHGVWNEEGISLVIRVLPPWWLTIWFFLSLVGLIILAWLLFYRYRTRSLRIQGVRLAQLVSDQTKQLRESNQKLQERTKELNDFNQVLEERQNVIIDQTKMLKSQAEHLQASNEELVKLVATRDKMFSIIAHDLRSPFNTILGFTGLLTEAFDEKDSERMKQYARYIHDSSISVFNLLENLLFWSRSQTNQILFKPHLSQLDEIVEDSLSLVRESAVKKNQTIDISEYQNYEVFMDVDMMRSVVRNLIINAIKFTLPKGSIKISSRLNEDLVEVSISDTGKGMSQSDIDRISKNLSISSTPGTSGEIGSGLGLSLSYEFIKMNGGELIIESTIGKGSTFTFTLPRKSKD